MASLIFSGMSGSAVADAAGIGKIIIEMMTKSGHYTRGYAAAITAASATIGPIIPPSIPMVLYALVSNTSIGYLFLGGIVPGLFMGAVLMGMNWVHLPPARFRARRPGAAARTARADGPGVPGAPDAGDPALRDLRRRHDADRGGGGRGVLCADARPGCSTARSVSATLYHILVDSARSSAAVGLVIGGALILNFVVASENIPGADGARSWSVWTSIRWSSCWA